MAVAWIPTVEKRKEKKGKRKGGKRGGRKGLFIPSLDGAKSKRDLPALIILVPKAGKLQGWTVNILRYGGNIRYRTKNAW